MAKITEKEFWRAVMISWSWREAIVQDHLLLYGMDHRCTECTDFPQVDSLSEIIKKERAKNHGKRTG